MASSTTWGDHVIAGLRSQGIDLADCPYCGSPAAVEDYELGSVIICPTEHCPETP